MNTPHVVFVGVGTGLAETVRAILEHKGAEVTELRHCNELPAPGPTVRPQVIVLGLAEHDRDCEQMMRLAAGHPDSRIIILAGDGQAREASLALQAGVFDYLCSPCEPAVLAARILDAVGARNAGPEKTAAGIMIPLDDYTCVQAGCTVRDGIEKLKLSAEKLISQGLVMQSGHRAVLVFDGSELVGVLTMRNLIDALRPDYLLSGQDGLLSSLRYSSMFWSGLFSARVEELQDKCVRDIMNPSPPMVDAQANLMRIVQLMHETNRRRVVVEEDGRVVGVVREQELFYEISRQMLSR